MRAWGDVGKSVRFKAGASARGGLRGRRAPERGSEIVQSVVAVPLVLLVVFATVQAGGMMLSVNRLTADLARACRSKIAITLRDPSLLPQMRMTLRQTDYLDDAVFVGLGLVEAARIASANPDLHIMGEMPAVPDNIAALVNASQTTGLFGLRAAPAHLTPPLLRACRAAGLFTMSLPTNDPRTLDTLIRGGVNFIETARPDLAAALLPEGKKARPQRFPMRGID